MTRCAYFQQVQQVVTYLRERVLYSFSSSLCCREKQFSFILMCNVALWSEVEKSSIDWSLIRGNPLVELGRGRDIQQTSMFSSFRIKFIRMWFMERSSTSFRQSWFIWQISCTTCVIWNVVHQLAGMGIVWENILFGRKLWSRNLKELTKRSS